MGARVSAAVERVLACTDAGQTAYAAAKAEGIALSTIYRAQKRQREAQAAKEKRGVEAAAQNSVKHD